MPMCPHCKPHPLAMTQDLPPSSLTPGDLARINPLQDLKIVYHCLLP